MSTTEDTTEMFIEKVRLHPILYDLNNPGYKNLRKKDKVWDSIGAVFQMDGDFAKKKWKNLRDTYAKYLKSIKTTNGRAPRKNYGNWQWAEQMKFLKPHLSLAKTLNDNDCYEKDNTEQIATHNVPVNCNDFELESELVAQTSVSHYAEIIAAQNAPDTPVNQVLQYLQSKPQKRSLSQMDDLENIFMGYAKSVKKLSPRRQSIIKLKLAQIIAEQELSEIDENSTRAAHDSSSANVSDYGNRQSGNFSEND